MTWVRMDDRFHRNPKQLQLSDAAFRVWVCSWSYCAEEKQLTGFMTTAQAQSLTRSFGKSLKVIAELVKANAWEQLSDGYLIHDYEEYLDEGSKHRTRKWRTEKREGDASVTSPPRHGDDPGDAAVTRAHARRVYPVPEPVPVTRNSELSSPPDPPRGRQEGGNPGARIAKATHETLGRALSANDIERIHGWPFEFPHLPESEIVTEVTAMANAAKAKGEPIHTVRYFEPRLQECNARKVDGQLGQRKGRTSGFTAIGDVG